MSPYWGITASCFGFVGGALLTLDALAVKKRIYQESEKNEAREAAEAEGGSFGDRSGKVIESEQGVRTWYAARSLRWNRARFAFVAAAFLIDTIGKVQEVLGPHH
jgi:hypothetical protein